MKVVSTGIQGLEIIHPAVFEDGRGYFFESYNESVFAKHGISTSFVQDNQSLSDKGVLRGLHFQNPPHAQAKLVRVIKGRVLDVVVDVRQKSATYGKHFSIELNEDNKTMLFIPVGFAHGFLVLQNQTIFAYKCSNLYNKKSEEGIRWNDPDLKINWGVDSPLVSDKDRTAGLFKDYRSKF